MNNNFDTNHFVMCPKSIIYEFDVLSASLYGLIWSFSQMKLGYCKLSQRQMAEKLGCSPRTLNSKFGELKKAGLIKVISRNKYPDGGGLLHTITNKHALHALDDKYRDKFSNGDNSYE